MRFVRGTPTAAAILCLWALSLRAQESRHIRFQDLPAGWAESESSFNRYIEELGRRTRERLLEGENDHLIAYLLQSGRFTTEPKIEPALSAMEYLRTDAPAGRVPAAVERRIGDLAHIDDGQILRLRYEDFVQDPISDMERICTHCGLQMTNDMAKTVKETVRRPIGTLSGSDLSLMF